MPLRRNRRTRLRAGGISTDEQEYLMLGPHTAICSDPFPDLDAMRRAWAKHRDTLLAHALPGRRPWAFWHFDCGVQKVDGINELRELVSRDMISPDEAAAIERRREDLRGYVAPNLFSSAETLRAEGGHVDDAMLIEFISRFEFAEKWHRWRGRVDVADRYSTAIEHAAEILRERGTE